MDMKHVSDMIRPVSNKALEVQPTTDLTKSKWQTFLYCGCVISAWAALSIGVCFVVMGFVYVAAGEAV